MKRAIVILTNLRASLWLAWHWKDLRQETRDNIFQDMLRIHGYHRRRAGHGLDAAVAKAQEEQP